MEASDLSSQSLLIHLTRMCCSSPKQYPFTLILIERTLTSNSPHAEWIEKCIDATNGHALSYTIHPFSVDNIEHILERFSFSPPFISTNAAKIHLQSGGVPLNTLLILKHICNKEFLELSVNGLVFSHSVNFEKIRLPTQMIDQMVDQLKQIEDNSLNVLICASQIGFIFEERLIADAMQVPIIKISQELFKIQNKWGIITDIREEDCNGVYKFVNANYIEAIYKFIFEDFSCSSGYKSVPQLLKQYNSRLSIALENILESGEGNSEKIYKLSEYSYISGNQKICFKYSYKRLLKNIFFNFLFLY